jgi:hypothetical protein
MGEVVGPTSTMPGHSHELPKGTKCDRHPQRAAVARIQGETDSMGAELLDLCQVCLDAMKAAQRSADTSGICDWCKQPADKRFHRRDIDEGMSGPVYLVCRPCIDKDNKAIADELAAWDERHGLDDWED